MNEGVARSTCPCGESLWVALRWNGFYIVPVYFPDGERPVAGTEIRECPACGNPLGTGIVPSPAFTPLGSLA